MTHHVRITKENAFLTLLVIGTVVPLSQFVPWLMRHGVDVPLFVTEVFATPISSYFGWDVVISVLALLVVAVVDDVLTRKQRAIVAIGSLLGASVGLPLYLWLRERRSRTHVRGSQAFDLNDSGCAA
ncbi:DUF2834 domain-containing protein [Mycolicibacterium arenosum]|uniref:DUF2834 domain-containing protein n=1 Tax=Mycolicibacterium arenosum TaxID=2952157 RepID=A0ABT1M829_9MYCO|nr:DUF2834 domain-containing protein [Mycolicibacterium sp. CAU 1645]MCP9274972.1 DUF2834 domain-containing protein [Mycolicibacterium sp. CAU 1645]